MRMRRGTKSLAIGKEQLGFHNGGTPLIWPSAPTSLIRWTFGGSELDNVVVCVQREGVVQVRECLG
jgi:hypothetical protein